MDYLLNLEKANSEPVNREKRYSQPNTPQQTLRTFDKSQIQSLKMSKQQHHGTFIMGV
jgi:hypothetical protein